MHKALVVNFPDLRSSAFCPCGYEGERREGERAEQTASIDALAHFEQALPDSWAREASSLARILHCPLCKTSMWEDVEDGEAECNNHIFRVTDTRRATVLTLENDYSDTSSGMVVDLSWDTRCPVVNCPGDLLDRYSNYTDSSDYQCSHGHEFVAHMEVAPFLVCELS